MNNWKKMLIAALALSACLAFAACTDGVPNFNAGDGENAGETGSESTGESIGESTGESTDESTIECTHEYETAVTAPTCTVDGYTTYTCKACGDTYKDDTVAAKHDYEKTVHPATCSAKGYTEYICRVCEDTYQDSEVEKLAHQYQDVTVDPTCENKGYTEHTCEVCGDCYKDNEVETTGHLYVDTVVEATCTTGGYTTHTCEHCGETTRDSEVAELGHDMCPQGFFSYPTLTKSGTFRSICSRCNKGEMQRISYKDIVPNAYAGNSSTPVAIGVDISYYQNDKDPNKHVNFPAMKAAGIDYVILRAGYSGRKDPCFETNYADARAAGLDIGVYIYTYSTTIEGAQQDARDLLTWIEGKQFEYPIYFDLENKSQQAMSPTELRDMTNAFFEIMQSNGYFTSLYIYENFLQNYLDTAYTIETYDIWYARYKTNWQNWNFSASGVPDWTYGGQYTGMFGMWQFTDSSIINGVYAGGNGYNASGVVDTNLCYKDYPSLIKQYGLNGFSPTGSTGGNTGGSTGGNTGGSTGGSTGGDTSTDTKEYVWIVAAVSLNVRSTPDFQAGDTNKLGVAHNGEKFEVLEKNAAYTKILWNGQEAYISAKPEYVSFTQP